MIGQRLILARKASGLSLRALSDKIDNLVSAQAISKYERDEDMPRSRVLIALAEALDVSVDYLLGDDKLQLEGIEFRKKHISRVKEQKQIEAQALHLIEKYLMVESILNLPSVNWNKPWEAPYPIHNYADADRAARSMREHWGLGIDPIPNFVELLEGNGIKILSFPLSENIHGLTAYACPANHESIPLIVVNNQEWGERQRFTLAHELGHQVLEILDPGLEEERVCHRFASAFLMPVEGLWSEIGKSRKSIGWPELIQLKLIFKVSIQALTYRCKDLGIINQSLFVSYFQKFKELGWRDPPYQEPHAISCDDEKPMRFERLCYRALAEEAISEAKAAELLCISVRELNERMDEPPALYMDENSRI